MAGAQKFSLLFLFAVVNLVLFFNFFSFKKDKPGSAKLRGDEGVVTQESNAEYVPTNLSFESHFATEFSSQIGRLEMPAHPFMHCGSLDKEHDAMSGENIRLHERKGYENLKFTGGSFAECVEKVGQAPYNRVNGNNWNLGVGDGNTEFERFKDSDQLFPQESSMHVIIEAGANVGVDTKSLLKACMGHFGSATQCHLITFEPLATFIPKLEKNLNQAGYEGKYDVVQEGLALFDGEILMKEEQGSSQVITKEEANRRRSAGKSVVAVKLGAAVRHVGAIFAKYPSATFSLHMNCEGCEFGVVMALHGAGLLKRFSSVQYGSHRLPWVTEPSPICQYCVARAMLQDAGFVCQWGVPWSWERHINRGVGIA